MVALKINDLRRVFLPALGSLLFNGSRQLLTRSKHSLKDRLANGLDAICREGLEEGISRPTVLHDASGHCKFMLVSSFALPGILG